MKETELAKHIIKYLKKQQYEIYQEVSIYSRIADIVAKKDDQIWVIECKKSMSLALLEQAYYYLKFADKVSAAIIKPKRRTRSFDFGKYLLMTKGIGCLEYSKNKYSEYIHESLSPNLLNPALKDRVILYEEQKNFKNAGGKGAYHFTSFKKTVQELYFYVNDHPGILLKDALKSIDHHYSSEKSAYSSIKKMIDTNVINCLKLYEKKIYAQPNWNWGEHFKGL